MLYKWFNRGSHFLIAVWILLSFLILVCNGFFLSTTTSPLPNMAFSNILMKFQRSYDLKTSFGIDSIFCLFFFWGLYLLLIIGVLVKDDQGTSLLNYREYSTSAARPYLFFAGLAFLSDCIEGILFVLLGQISRIHLHRKNAGLFHLVVLFSVLVVEKVSPAQF